MSKEFRIFILATGLALASTALFAQSNSQVPAAAPIRASDSLKAPVRSLTLVFAVGSGDKAPEEEGENIQFKHSSIVKKLASMTGLSKEAVYWIFIVINFAILAAVLRWVLRQLLPNGFNPRTAEIQKGIEEARKASADAGARLGEIEGRLAKLDAEITEIRSAAEADFSLEEQRIKAAAEQDAKNVIAGAEQEIAAAARSAQRELKAFVADLAVGLAEKKIRVDDATDKALVRGFASQLGKDGK